jgi:hypothetical protein
MAGLQQQKHTDFAWLFKFPPAGVAALMSLFILSASLLLLHCKVQMPISAASNEMPHS